MRKMAKKLRGLPAPTDEALLLKAFGLPEQDWTIGNAIVLKTVLGAMAGNKDDRRDYMRMTGDDPDVAAKEADLDLKKKQAEQKNEISADVEDLRPVAELLNEPDTND